MTRETVTLDRVTWAVWDARLGIVADVYRLRRDRWCVEDYNDGGFAFFRTRGQAFHYANQLPDETET